MMSEQAKALMDADVKDTADFNKGLLSPMAYVNRAGKRQREWNAIPVSERSLV